MNLCLFLFRPLIFLGSDKSLPSAEVSRPVGTAGEVGGPIGIDDAKETGWPPRAAEEETVFPPSAAEENGCQAMANEDAGWPVASRRRQGKILDEWHLQENCVAGQHW